MNESSYISIAPYLDVLYRHRVSAVCVLVVGLILTAVLVSVYPERYQSTAVLIMRNPEVSGEYIKNQPKGSLQAHLHLLGDLALSEDQLSNVIQHYNLYPKARARHVTMPDIVKDMRKEIVVDMSQGSRFHKESGQSFSISFAYTNPQTAQQVTARLADVFINDDLASRVRDATATTQFVGRQLTQINRELAKKGRELKDLQNEFSGSLPGDLQNNQQALGDLESRLRHDGELIAELELKQMQISDQLVQAHQQDLTITTSSGTQTAGSPQALLNDLETRLTRLKSQYSDSYPDVVSLKAEIAAVKKEVKDREAHPQKYESPVERQLKSENAAIALKIANTKQDSATLKHEIAEINQRIAETPAHAQALAGVTRDYNVLSATYHELLGKKLAAKMSENLEQEQEGEHMEVLDSATLPMRPLQPDRLSIAVGGTLLSVLLALALPFILFFTDTSFRDPEDITNVHGLTVAATIPLVERIESQGSAKRLMLTAFAVSSTCTALGVCAIWFAAMKGIL